MTLETPAAPGPTESGIVSEESVPVYDPLKLMELADEAGEIVAQRFINEYLALLPHRQDRILAKLAVGDDETAMDAVLSLKTTSAMVGAVRLSGYCQHLQDQMALALDHLSDIVMQRVREGLRDALAETVERAVAEEMARFSSSKK